MKRLISFIKQLFQSFGNDKIGLLSSAFAYTAIFSIGPLLLVVISVASLILGQKAANGELASQLTSTLGSSAAHTLQTVIAHSHNATKSGIALIIGVVGVLTGAAGITSQLQTSFDTIMNITPDPKGGIKRTIYVKIKNILCVLLASMLIAASLLVSALVIGLSSTIHHRLHTPAWTIEAVNEAVSLIVFAGLVYFIYRIIPDVIVPRKILATCSLIISCLFLVGKIILSIVIGRNATASAYGAAAALVTLLLWVFYTGEILFLGIEGVKVYGARNSITYAPKRFNLKRTTLHIDNKKRSGTVLEAYQRGIQKGMRK